jgi:hypothetical protein
MPRLIVEHSFDPPLTDEEHHRASARLDPCLEAYGGHWLCTYLSHDRRRMICEFEAPDTESVRTALHSAEVAFDRVWSSEVFRRGEPDVK